MNKGVGGLSVLKRVGLGIVQLEEQEKDILARQFAPKEDRCLLKNLRNMRKSGKAVSQVFAIRIQRKALQW